MKSLDELKNFFSSGSGGSLLFTKDMFAGGDVARLKIVPEFDHWCLPFEQEYQGKKSKKGAVRVIWIKGKGDYEYKVAILPGSVVAGVIGLLEAEHNLLDESTGVPVQVTKTGSGITTKYTVLPFGKPFDNSQAPLPEEFQTLEEAVNTLLKPKEEDKSDEISW